MERNPKIKMAETLDAKYTHRPDQAGCNMIEKTVMKWVEDDQP